MVLIEARVDTVVTADNEDVDMIEMLKTQFEYKGDEKEGGEDNEDEGGEDNEDAHSTGLTEGVKKLQVKQTS